MDIQQTSPPALFLFFFFSTPLSSSRFLSATLGTVSLSSFFCLWVEVSVRVSVCFVWGGMRGVSACRLVEPRNRVFSTTDSERGEDGRGCLFFLFFFSFSVASWEAHEAPVSHPHPAGDVCPLLLPPLIFFFFLIFFSLSLEHRRKRVKKTAGERSREDREKGLEEV